MNTEAKLIEVIFVDDYGNEAQPFNSYNEAEQNAISGELCGKIYQLYSNGTYLLDEVDFADRRYDDHTENCDREK